MSKFVEDVIAGASSKDSKESKEDDQTQKVGDDQTKPQEQNPEE